MQANGGTDITLTLPAATGTLATIADITSGATSALDHGTNSGTSLTFDGTQTNDIALLNTLVTSGNIQLNLPDDNGGTLLSSGGDRYYNF